MKAASSLWCSRTPSSASLTSEGQERHLNNHKPYPRGVNGEQTSAASIVAGMAECGNAAEVGIYINTY